MSDKKPKERMIKTSIDLTTGQYQFLKIKALERKMRGQDPSFVTIIRELIEADRRKMVVFIIVGLLCIAHSLPAAASYMPFNTNVNLNVGIGTSTPMGALAVMSGNVGIGTWVPVGALDIKTGNNVLVENGNVGIGTTFVGGAGEAALTVMNGNVGIGTWLTPGELTFPGGGSITGSSGGLTIAASGTNQGVTLNPTGSGYITAGGNGLIANTVEAAAITVLNSNISLPLVSGSALPSNISLNSSLYVDYIGGNVGIGTSAPTGMLEIEGGNVGIGTWISPAGGSNNLVVNGNIGIGTTKIGGTGEGALTVMNGNVGVGTWVPGMSVDVNGTVRATAMLIGANNVCQSTGTNCPAGGTNPWLVVQAAGNVGISTIRTVGIGTTSAGAGAGLVVMNGNVGIGTWAPTQALNVVGVAMASNFASTGTTISGTGDTALGQLSGGGTITASGASGAFAGGASNVSSAAASISSSGPGSIAYGQAFGFTDPASISSTQAGSFAVGLALGGTLSATYYGSVAMGEAYIGDTLTSTSNGSIAMGYSAGTLQATAQGAIAIGDTVQANATDSEAFGLNVVNNMPNSFMVGFSTTPTFTVTGNNVGIGTWVPAKPFSVTGDTYLNGNVGIGTSTTTAGAALSIMNGNVGIGTWVPAVMFQVSNGSDPFAVDSNGNVGIGTMKTSTAALSVMSGNVGIGTWVPAKLFSVTGDTYHKGNIGISTSITTAGAALSVMNGNVGIGTWVPSQQVDIKGSGTSEITIQNNWDGGVGAWINMSTDGPSGIGTGGAGQSPWLAYVQSGGEWFTNAAAGDMAYRNLSGRLLYGNSTGNATMAITGGNVGIGSINPGVLLDVGTPATTAGVIRLAGATAGALTINVPATVTTWTMTLPATQNPVAGDQLTVAAANSGVTSWAVAGSLRKWKNIIGPADSFDALDKILHAKVYRFHYKPGMGTGDIKTEYVGVMADEAPWAMHYEGGVVNPVNTLGYMILGIQSLNKEIDGLKKENRDLLNKYQNLQQEVDGLKNNK